MGNIIKGLWKRIKPY